jgi:Tfp pilus assembly protein PilX
MKRLYSNQAGLVLGVAVMLMLLIGLIVVVLARILYSEANL